jgi:putative aldouronate transport system permease protein
VLPLGKPILVTISLFSGLGYWNDWTNGLYYISESRMLSIQALLNRMIQDIQALMANSTADSGALMRIPQVSIRMAIAFVAVLPILITYPFLQRYFESGIMLGAVKG